MMQGGLDDLRNDVARALRRNDIDPDVLASLLQGLQGIGIDFTNARQGLIDFQLKASGCPARSCVSYKLKPEQPLRHEGEWWQRSCGGVLWRAGQEGAE